MVPVSLLLPPRNYSPMAATEKPATQLVLIIDQGTVSPLAPANPDELVMTSRERRGPAHWHRPHYPQSKLTSTEPESRRPAQRAAKPNGPNPPDTHLPRQTYSLVGHPSQPLCTLLPQPTHQVACGEALHKAVSQSDNALTIQVKTIFP